ncbi:hypothetical protein BRD01_09360 [Halobacteriales archaeon QS_8_65_32]|nr:MAG: hypothetical protein BRD01_09360 [Halobacteriales archaeon QS_8_65_32]
MGPPILDTGGVENRCSQCGTVGVVGSTESTGWLDDRFDPNGGGRRSTGPTGPVERTEPDGSGAGLCARCFAASTIAAFCK